MTGYSIGRQNGWLSTNDIREMEDMNLVSAEEGGHLYLINGNMTKLKDAGFLCMQGYGQVLIFVDKVANSWHSNIRKWQNKLVKKLKLLKK